jgi:hypothetical protein
MISHFSGLVIIVSFQTSRICSVSYKSFTAAVVLAVAFWVSTVYTCWWTPASQRIHANASAEVSVWPSFFCHRRWRKSVSLQNIAVIVTFENNLWLIYLTFECCYRNKIEDGKTSLTVITCTDLQNMWMGKEYSTTITARKVLCLHLAILLRKTN